MTTFSITELDKEGFVLVRSCFDLKSINALHQLFPDNERCRAGIRNLLVDFAAVVNLVRSDTIRSLVLPVQGENTIAVRALYFNKTADANWRVRWHQDKTIAVKSRKDIPGFNAWSIKGDVVHVHPPVEVMENMMALRIHLDGAGEDSGGLWMYPGSHKNGICTSDAMEKIQEQTNVTCPSVEAGDVLLIRPLIVHSSERCVANQRRVVHIEFAGGPLSKPLQWHQEIRIVS